MALVACGNESTAVEPDDLTQVGTETPAALAQYDLNLKFIKAYESRCTVIDAALPRVLVTGYGRFQGIENNLTGRLVAKMVGATYPTLPAMASAPFDPGALTVVRTQVLDLDGVRANVCGMVLPVFWDVAPLMVETESAAFKPDVILMNGVGPARTPLRIELGSANDAIPSLDGSDSLAPWDKSSTGKTQAVVRSEPVGMGLASRLPFAQVRAAAEKALASAGANDMDLPDSIRGVRFAAFPSNYLTYLCNNVVFVTNYLATHPGKRVTLLQSSTRRTSRVVTARGGDATLARAFVHWPSLSSDSELAAAHSILRAMLGAATRDRNRAVSGAQVTPDL